MDAFKKIFLISPQTLRSRADDEIEKQLDSEMLKSLERQRLLREEHEQSKLSRQRNKTSLIQVRIVYSILSVQFIYCL